MLLTMKEVAERLKVSSETARTLAKAYMPHVRVGRQIRVTQDALDRFLKRHTEQP